MAMDQPKKMRRTSLRIIILCLCVCLFLSVGVTYARYRTELMTISYWFQPSNQDTIVMRGLVRDEAEARSGVWNLPPENWIYLDWDTAQLEFSVSNGTSTKDFAIRDQQVTVQLIASLNIQNPEALTVSLVTLDEEGREVIYYGVPEEIRRGSALHGLYGPGWVYTFVDENDVGQTFFLKGNRLSYHNITVSVEGYVEPALLSIELKGSYVSSD